MAELNTSSWSETDNSNNAASPNGWTTGSMQPNQVEPTARAMMGAIKRFWGRVNPVYTSGGSGGAYTWTPTDTGNPTTLAQGEIYAFKANFTSAGSDTLNVNSLGALGLYQQSSSGPVAVTAGYIQTNQMVLVAYDGALNGNAGGFQILSVSPAAAAPPRGSLAGLTLSTAGGTGTFGIAAGEAANSTNAVMMALGSAYTKTTASWSVGSGNGALDTGSIAPSTWYHTYLIERLDTGVVDVLLSLSATSPTLPSNYTVFRRFGSMLTDPSSHWTAFKQYARSFYWVQPVLDASSVNISANTPISVTLGSVPPGLKVRPLIGAIFFNITPVAATGVVYDPDLGDPGTLRARLAAANASSTPEIGAPQGDFYCNTSQQVRAASSNAQALTINTFGWVDDFSLFS